MTRRSVTVLLQRQLPSGQSKIFLLRIGLVVVEFLRSRLNKDTRLLSKLHYNTEVGLKRGRFTHHFVLEALTVSLELVILCFHDFVVELLGSQRCHRFRLLAAAGDGGALRTKTIVRVLKQRFGEGLFFRRASSIAFCPAFLEAG